jgi:hypothetical protein
MTGIMRTSLAILTGALLAAPMALPSGTAVAAAPAVAARADRLVTIPAGTVLRLRVDRGFGSDISRVEDPVGATLLRPVVVGGRTVLPSGSAVSGYVSEAARPGKVKGRGRVAVRFTRVVPAGDNDRYAMRTQSWAAVAPATKKKDALTIALPAAGGAGLGALIGGKKGAGIGALAGGGTGTAVVLTTRGRNVRINRGATIAVRLAEPLTVRIDG